MVATTVNNSYTESPLHRHQSVLILSSKKIYKKPVCGENGTCGTIYMYIGNLLRIWRVSSVAAEPQWTTIRVRITAQASYCCPYGSPWPTSDKRYADKITKLLFRAFYCCCRCTRGNNACNEGGTWMTAAPGTRATAPPRITLHLLNLRQTSSLVRICTAVGGRKRGVLVRNMSTIVAVTRCLGGPILPETGMDVCPSVY